MERQELITKLQEIMPLVNRWVELADLKVKNHKRVCELERAIEKEKPTIGNIIQKVWLSFLCCFFLGGILLLPIEWLTPIKITFRFYLVYTIILTVILTVVLVAKSKKDLVVMQNNLPRVKAEYAEVENQFAREVTANLPKIYAVIPQNYAYPHAINQIYSYLKNCRADNLKEAINLFEQEQQQKEQKAKMDALGNQLTQVQKTQDELEQRVAGAEFQASQAFIMSMHNREND